MINNLISIIPIALPYTCIILISLFYAVIFKRKVFETLFLSIGTIILILFFSGILNFRGSLLFGYIVIILFSLISGLFIIKKFIKNKTLIKNISLIPSLIIFTTFLCITIYMNYERLFFNWDEFSHWGIIVKSMYSFDALGSLKNTNLMYSSYLPGTSLFQYFFCRPFPIFIEYPAYIAQNLFFFSIIVTFVRKFDLKNVLFIGTAFILPLLMDAKFYSSLYVDGLLGILFGSVILFYYYFNFPKIKFSMLMVSITSVILTITKDMGIVFAGIALIVISADMLLFQRKEINSFFIDAKYKVQKFKNSLYLIIPFISILFIQLIWTLHLRIADVKNIVISSSPTSFADVLENGLFPYQREVALIFKDALFNRPILPLPHSIVTITITLLLLIMIIGLLLRKKSSNPFRLTLTLLGVLFGQIIYTGVLLIYYVFITNEYVGRVLSSYERYMYSYLLGIFFTFLLFLILKTEWRWEFKKVNILIRNFLVILSFITIFLVYNFIFNQTKPIVETEIFDARQSVQNTIQARENYNKLLIWSKYLKDEKYKPYLISQGDRGFDMLMMSYVLFPSHIKWEGIYNFSIALEPYYPELGDPWTMIISADDWEKYILENNYDLLYIFKSDEEFKDTYGAYFEKIEDNCLYKITTNTQGELKLISISQ